MSATSVRFLFLVTFRAVRHYILNFLAKKEAVRNCMLRLRPRQGNWRLKCAAVQDRALKLYPVHHLSFNHTTFHHQTIDHSSFHHYYNSSFDS